VQFTTKYLIQQQIKTRKALLTQRETHNSGAPSYADDP